MATQQTRRAIVLDGGSLFRRVLRLYPYDSEEDRQRAIVVSMISIIFGVFGTIGGVLLLVLPVDVAQILALTNIGLGLSYLLVYAAARSGRLPLARAAFILLALTVPAVQSIPFEFVSPQIAALAYAVPIFMTAFLVGAAWTLPVVLVSITLLGASLTLHQIGSLADVATMLNAGVTGTPLISFVQAVLLLGIVGLLSSLIGANVVAWARSAERRAAQFETAGVISETAAAAPSLRDLLFEVTERVRDVYGFYHAQVFLLGEDGSVARLEASTGRAGEALLARGHSLEVGSQSIIGMCTASGQPVVVNNVHASDVHRPNELLPDTQAELALPLLVGEEVIGALDVQSTAINAFQPQDVRSLQVMAIQLAAAIDKARLVDELQARVADNERMFEEMQSTLVQLDELNRSLMQEGWSDYLRSKRRESVGYTLRGENIQPDESWTPAMQQVYEGAPHVVRQEGDTSTLALPVRMRGEVIGVLEVARSGGRAWSQPEMDLARTLVEQLALAVESARMYEQARQSTGREQILNQIGQDIQAAHSVDEVLRTALAELGDVLGASHGVVQIAPRTDTAAAARGRERVAAPELQA